MGGGVGVGPAGVGVFGGGFAAFTVEVLEKLRANTNRRMPTRLITRRVDLGIVCSSGVLIRLSIHDTNAQPGLLTTGNPLATLNFYPMIQV
jgi:hypothetical protein